jgi:hypothetical protein
MRKFLILIAMVGLGACNNNTPEPVAPSIKRVDSAVAAASDTIQAVPVDSIRR